MPVSAVPKSMMETSEPAVENIGTFPAEIFVSQRALYDTFAEAMKRVATIERVALYARVSAKDDRQDLENQLIVLRG